MAIKVNNEIIPEEAVQYEMSRLVSFYSQHMPPEQVKERLGEIKERATEQAIGAKLLMDEAHRLDIRVSEDDLNEKLDEFKDKCGGADGFSAFLKERNLSVEMVKDGIERGRRVDLLVEKVTSDINDPTEEEIETYFNEHKAELTKSEQAEAKHILIKTDEGEDKEKAREAIAELRRQIEEGAEFDALASEHSACPSGKSAGGSLGWFSRGMMVPEFDAAVFDMSVGDLSDIIETQFGYHLILKTGEQEAGSPDLVESRDQIRDLLRHSMRGEAVTAYVAELREKADVVID
jgi:parvulin-like peptidyl-prolyl isomerase